MLSTTSLLFVPIANLTLAMVSDSGVTIMNRSSQRRVFSSKMLLIEGHKSQFPFSGENEFYHYCSLCHMLEIVIGIGPLRLCYEGLVHLSCEAFQFQKIYICLSGCCRGG
jgi:hypothetical protein